MPVLNVFAGPNGSGKSTIVALTDFEGKQNLLDPDAIARRIDPGFPQRAAIQAGREVLRRAHEYIQRGESFAIETTIVRWMDEFRNRSGAEGRVLRQAILRLYRRSRI